MKWLQKNDEIELSMQACVAAIREHTRGDKDIMVGPYS